VTLADDIAADLAANQYDADESPNAVTVSYNGGSNITGILEFDENLGTSQGAISARAYLYVLKTDVPNPTNRDTALISGTTWYVKKVMAGDNYQWKILVTSDERAGF